VVFFFSRSPSCLFAVDRTSESNRQRLLDVWRSSGVVHYSLFVDMPTIFSRQTQQKRKIIRTMSFYTQDSGPACSAGPFLFVD